MALAEVANDVEPEEADEAPDARDARDRELSGLRAIREQLVGGEDGNGIFDDIEAGFTAQADRSNTAMDNWDAYKCRLSSSQYYNGNAKIFFPIISNAVRARATRFGNQLFPNSGRYIDCVTANGDIPYAEIALMEHYIRRLRLKNTIVKPMLKAGDLEGNYTIYVDWKDHKRRTMTRVTRPIQGDDGEPHDEYGEVEDVQEEETSDFGPDVEVIPDSDILILPVTAKTIDEALEVGGSVTIRRRYTKRTLKMMIEDGDIAPRAGKEYLESMQVPLDQPGRKDTSKNIGEAAGIRVRKGVSIGVVAEIWTRLKVGKERVLCRAYMGGPDKVLGCKKNPYWHDRCPVITEPLDRDPGMIKGKPPVSEAIDIQTAANDMVNEAVDVSNFAAMPIVAADPEANSRSSTMVLGLGAVWDIDPAKVEFKEFPALYEKLLPFINMCETAIFQTLGVNPSMLPQSTGKPGAKRNQAEVAMEQQVDLLTTADATSVAEDVLNQMLTLFMWLDHQFRDKPLTVRAFGPMGRRANMQEIGPLQINAGYEFMWLGVEAARNAAMAQQQIAALATMMKIPPQAIQGYRVDLAPALQQIALSQFGPRIAPLTLVSLKDEQSMSAEEENSMLAEGFDLPVHPQDDDLAHIRAHMQVVQETGDPSGNARFHIDKHNMQRVAKATAAAQQRAAQGPAPPGQGRGTQPGAMPGNARPGPRVPGAINEDRMSAAGAPGQPRKT